MDPKISVIISTIGRLSLKNALDSCIEFPEVVVVFDGKMDDGTRAVLSEYANIKHLETGTPFYDYGNTAKNMAMDAATGTHFVFMDDDDHFTPGAYKRFVEAATEKPNNFHSFPVFVGWVASGSLHINNLSMIGMLVPNAVETPRFDGKGLGEDFRFALQCAQIFPPHILHETEDLIASSAINFNTREELNDHLGQG